MKIKICFKNEIHVISKIPDTFAAFVSLLNSKFQSQLPAKWTLQYTDSDGDNILINDEKDYEEFTNPDPSASVSAAKVFVVPVDSFRSSQEVSKSQIIEKVEEKQDDDYQVIQKEEEVIKPEEVLPKEEEKPVVQEVVLETQETSQPSTDSGNKVEVEETENKVEEKEEEEEKIEQPVKEEVIPAEIKDQKILIDLDDLEKIITNMIDSRLPQVAETIKNQLSFEIKPVKENYSLDVSMDMNPYENAILQNEVLKPLKSEVKHFGISCSGCQMMPIVGIRYKCTVCPRFDLCENCEESCEHAHNFVKMKQRDLLDIFRPNPKVVIQAEPVLPVVYNPVPVENINVVAEPVEKKKEKLSRAQKKEQKKVSRNYFKNLQEKAKKLQKCFPKEDFDILCAYVNEAPEDMTLEELVENFKH